jgi:hypothetical protein
VTDQTALPTLENPHHRASLYLVGSLMVLDETTPIPDVTQVHSALLVLFTPLMTSTGLL